MVKYEMMGLAAKYGLNNVKEMLSTEIHSHVLCRELKSAVVYFTVICFISLF